MTRLRTADFYRTSSATSNHGAGANTVTLGVPRLKESIDVAKTVKTLSLTCYLREDIHKTVARRRTCRPDTTLERVRRVLQQEKRSFPRL